MRILITNDDGIKAPGIQALVRELSPKHELFIVAPDSERSGAGMSVTIKKPVSVSKISMDGVAGAYAVGGTPVDCVKIAVRKLINPLPDMIVSGINPGSNIGINLMYSGTVAGVLEGVFQGISGMALSMPSDDGPGYEYCAVVGGRIIERIFENNSHKKLGLNVNFPVCPHSAVKGVKITRQCSGGIIEDYRRVQAEEFCSQDVVSYEKEGKDACAHSQSDTSMKDDYILVGDVYCESGELGLDTAAVSGGWISITPIKPFLDDSDAYGIISGLKSDIYEVD